jgi:hypothetical protein
VLNLVIARVEIRLSGDYEGADRIAVILPTGEFLAADRVAITEITNDPALKPVKKKYCPIYMISGSWCSTE